MAVASGEVLVEGIDNVSVREASSLDVNEVCCWA